jgi:hypothetical protein
MTTSPVLDKKQKPGAEEEAVGMFGSVRARRRAFRTEFIESLTSSLARPAIPLTPYCGSARVAQILAVSPLCFTDMLVRRLRRQSTMTRIWEYAPGRKCIFVISCIVRPCDLSLW